MNLYQHTVLQELRIFLSSQDKRFPNEDVFASKFRLKEKSGPEPSRVCDNHFKHRDVVQKKTFEILTIRKCKMSKQNYWNIFQGKRSATIGEIRCSCRPMTVLDQVFVVGPPFVFSRPGKWPSLVISFKKYNNVSSIHLIEMPGDRIPRKVLLFHPTASFLGPSRQFLHPRWFFVLLPSSRRKLVKEDSRVRIPPPGRRAPPAQQDDRGQEGEQRQACHTGKPDNEPDRDAGTGGPILNDSFF